MTHIYRLLALLCAIALHAVVIRCDTESHYAQLLQGQGQDESDEMENLFTRMYINDVMNHENDAAYENPDALKSHFIQYVTKRFSEFIGGKRFSDFTEGRPNKRFSEFIGGKKRFSEFIGGKKRFSEFIGGKKRFSEFLGGKKRFSEFIGGKRGSRSVRLDAEKRDLDFLGGR